MTVIYVKLAFLVLLTVMWIFWERKQYRLKKYIEKREIIRRIIDMSPPAKLERPALVPVAGPHVHSWKQPPIPPRMSDWTHSTESIEFTLLGEMCECGARRVYQGPAYGWKEVQL